MSASWSAAFRALSPSSKATGAHSATWPSAISGAASAATAGFDSRAKTLVSIRRFALGT